MPDIDLRSYLATKQTLINRKLEAFIASKMPPGRLVQAMSYSLMAGGKRLRPILCLASSEAVGENGDRSMPAACALELIHTYSLIHDDLPAMDDDEIRRGKPTCHVAFDEATAILAGDALLTIAFQLLSSPGNVATVSVRKWMQVIQIISTAAGCGGMIEGQMRDLQSEGHQISIDALEAMHAHKTGALIIAAVQTGCILGDGDEYQYRQLTEYAQNIGLAFQIVDDILNIEGDPEMLGKAVGTDQQRGKNTYPALLGLEKSKRLAESKVAAALQALAAFDHRADALRAIADYILVRQK